MSRIHFYKMNGAGNDFILVDNSTRIFQGTESGVFSKICLSHTGIGADGVMLLEKSNKADFKLRYFNPDGLPAEMCGNGARCAVFLANYLKMAPQKCSFEINDVVYYADLISKNQVRLQMYPSEILVSPSEAKSLLSDEFSMAIGLRVGVPHFVLETKISLNELDVIRWGRYYRYHDKFKSSGTNVNFVFPIQQNILKARVYERGVERETLACGSGAVACAIFANQIYKWGSPISVHFPGGILKIEFEPGYKKIFLIGPVRVVFEGDLESSEFD
jgi:diaminopimelate epimerase